MIILQLLFISDLFITEYFGLKIYWKKTMDFKSAVDFCCPSFSLSYSVSVALQQVICGGKIHVFVVFNLQVVLVC